MMNETFCVVVFESTHDAIKTEKAIKAELTVTLIPTPREISASCGLSVRFSPEEIENVRRIVKTVGLERKRMFKLTLTPEGREVQELDWEV